MLPGLTTPLEPGLELALLGRDVGWRGSGGVIGHFAHLAPNLSLTLTPPPHPCSLQTLDKIEALERTPLTLPLP